MAFNAPFAGWRNNGGSGSRSAEGRHRLSELVSALSYALDITEGHPTGHCVRCCWIGVHVGRDALTAERPYRAAMPVSQAFEIMDGDIGAGIDPDCFDALRRAVAALEAAAAPAAARGAARRQDFGRA